MNLTFSIISLSNFHPPDYKLYSSRQPKGHTWLTNAPTPVFGLPLPWAHQHMPPSWAGGGHVNISSKGPVVFIVHAMTYTFLVAQHMFCLHDLFSYLCLWSCHNRLWMHSRMPLDQSRIHHPPLSPHSVVCLCTSDLGPSLWHLFLLKLI